FRPHEPDRPVPSTHWWGKDQVPALAGDGPGRGHFPRGDPTGRGGTHPGAWWAGAVQLPPVAGTDEQHHQSAYEAALPAHPAGKSHGGRVRIAAAAAHDHARPDPPAENR